MSEVRATDYFAIVPEFVLYAPISANAVRLFAVLHRYANTNLRAWPSRKTLADAMGVSPATIDRAKDELVSLGAVTVQARTSDSGDPTSNLYTLRMTNPANGEPSAPVRKGMRTGGDTGMRTSADLSKASKNQRQIQMSPNERAHADKAGHVASLLRLGRQEAANDYIASQEPAVREYLEQVFATLVVQP